MPSRAHLAEFIGTFFFVFAAAGAGLLAPSAAGPLATAIAAGSALLAMTAAASHISGAHFNPAVTLGLIAAGRFETEKAPAYIVAQVAGGTAAAFMLSLVAAGASGALPSSDLGSVANHFGGSGPFGLGAALVVEVIATALLVIVYLGATARRAPPGLWPMAVGLGLAALYLVARPVTNASLNPALSTGLALFAGTQALSQLWLFWVAPILGGVIGGGVSRALQDE